MARAATTAEVRLLLVLSVLLRDEDGAELRVPDCRERTRESAALDACLAGDSAEDLELDLFAERLGMKN